MPREYGDFLDALPQEVTDSLPDGVLSEDGEAVSDAAREMTSPAYLLSMLAEAFGAGLSDLLPTLLLLFGIVILSAVFRAMSAGLFQNTAAESELCIRLCTYCVTVGVAVSSLERLEHYFESLFSAVSAFLPLSAVLYAMGGNLTAAASSTATLTATLTLCQFLCSRTVIPVFCLCLSLSFLSVLDGASALSGQSLSASVKRWYGYGLGLIMMILTASLGMQSILSAKADSVAMRSARFVASGFIPVTGGTVASTLGTLAASVELLRGAVGAVGIGVILMLLIPVIVHIALLRGIYALASFLAGMLGCGGEQKLLSEIGGLYGYQEGIAVLCSVIFLIAMAVFASAAASVG